MNVDQLELRQLRCLVAVAEEGTFTDAAIRLRTSQPAVSRAIARLEDALGMRLVERTTRTVALTPAGQAFYPQLLAALAIIDNAVGEVRGRVRPLRLGYAWAAFGRHTAAILRQWRDEQPGVPLEVHRIDERYAGLARGRVDVAVVRGAIAAPALRYELLFQERRVAALPAGHRLATRPELSIRELTDRVALTPSVGTTTLDLWPANARPQATVDVDNVDEFLTAIASGAAIGVTSESTEFQHPYPGIVFIPLTGVAAVPVHLVWPAVRPHPAVARFAEHVRRVTAP